MENTNWKKWYENVALDDNNKMIIEIAVTKYFKKNICDIDEYISFDYEKNRDITLEYTDNGEYVMDKKVVIKSLKEYFEIGEKKNEL